MCTQSSMCVVYMLCMFVCTYVWWLYFCVVYSVGVWEQGTVYVCAPQCGKIFNREKGVFISDIVIKYFWSHANIFQHLIRVCLTLLCSVHVCVWRGCVFTLCLPYVYRMFVYTCTLCMQMCLFASYTC